MDPVGLLVAVLFVCLICAIIHYLLPVGQGLKNILYLVVIILAILYVMRGSVRL